MRSLQSWMLFVVLFGVSPLFVAADVAAQEEEDTAAESCDLKQARAECEANARAQNAQGYWRLEVGRKFKDVMWKVIEAFEVGEPTNLPAVEAPGEDDQTIFLSSSDYEGWGDLFVVACQKLKACGQDPETREQPLAISLKASTEWPSVMATTLLSGFGEPQIDPTHVKWNWTTLVTGYRGPPFPLRRSLHHLSMDEVPFSQAARWLTDRAPAVWAILPSPWRPELSHVLAEFMDTALDLDTRTIYSNMGGDEDQAYRGKLKTWYRECRREDGSLKPECDPKKCTGSQEVQEDESGVCQYETWLQSEPGAPYVLGNVPESVLWGMGCDSGFTQTLAGWIFRRYLEGGADRITLFLVWGAVAADKVDMPDALRWAQRVRKRLKKTKLNKVDFYSERMDDIVARRSK